MTLAKSKTKLSPEMIELLDRVKKNNDNSPLNDLGPADLRILELHSQNILENFKVDAKKLLENQFKNDIPRNLAHLDELLLKNGINLVRAQKLGNVEKEREIQGEIERQKNVKNDLMVMQNSFQKLLTDPESLSLEALEKALVSVQNAQISQLEQACNAVKTQFEAYCRLKETEDSSMYSAVDVLGLDFNKNKDIANELENKIGSKKVENPEYLAILDAMTCIERGRYTKYPENTDNPVFISLNGSIEQCDKKMDVSDSFPKFLSTREGAGQYMAMLAQRETWEKWNRCGGTRMKMKLQMNLVYL